MTRKQISALNVGLRNFLINSGYSPTIIDFDKSVIKEDERYQVLALKKPDQMAFEIENLKWPFSKNSNYGLLIFDTEAQRLTSEIDLNTSFDFIGLEKIFDKELSLSFNDGNFLLKGEYIMFAQNGWMFGKNSDPYGCTNIAVFHITGKLVHAWKLSFHQSKVCLRDFRQIQGDRWFVKLETEDWQKLFMLVPDRIDGFVLVGEKTTHHTKRPILDAKTDDIKYWFSDEKNRPIVFVLARSYQLCVYGYDNYEKLLDATVNNSHVGELLVKIKNNQIIVGFSNKNSLVRAGKFTLSIVSGEV
jgi:hypothetical protein